MKSLMMDIQLSFTSRLVIGQSFQLRKLKQFMALTVLDNFLAQSFILLTVYAS